MTEFNYWFLQEVALVTQALLISSAESEKAKGIWRSFGITQIPLPSLGSNKQSAEQTSGLSVLLMDSVLRICCGSDFYDKEISISLTAELPSHESNATLPEICCTYVVR